MSDSFLSCGTTSIVPVIRERLSFAVLVQRAFKELTLAAGDIVAVDLSADLAPTINRAIEENLPNVSLVLTSPDNDSGTPIEAIAITPSDGRIEAIRSARELGIPFAYVDMPIAPAHLIGRGCTQDPEFVDDTYVLSVGVNRYLERLQPIMLHEGRLEPVDTLRERFMAAQVRRLQLAYDRVVLVCNAIHAKPIRSLLLSKEPLPIRNEGIAATVTPECYLADAATAAMYLDDYPAIVQSFDNRRANLGGMSFDKDVMLREAIQKAIAHSPGIGPSDNLLGLPVSTRVFIAFTQMLDRHQSNIGRKCARWQDIEKVMQGFFSGLELRTVRTALLKYENQIVPTGMEREDPKAEGPHWVSRSCNPYAHRYIFGQHTLDTGDDNRLKLWPPYKQHLNALRRRAYDYAYRRTNTSTVSPFRGSLEKGIDLRRTVRGMWQCPPTIYVCRTPSRFSKYSDEPVIWLLDDTESSSEFHKVWFGLVDRKEHQFMCACLASTDLGSPIPERTFLTIRKVYGLVTFCDAGVPLATVRQQHGAAFEQRVPRLRESFSGQPWWDVIAHQATLRAAKTVICVRSPGFAFRPSNKHPRGKPSRLTLDFLVPRKRGISPQPSFITPQGAGNITPRD